MELYQTKSKIAGRGHIDVQDNLYGVAVVRECTKCCTLKPIEEFYLTGQGRNKYRTKVCKSCQRKKQRLTHKAIDREPFWEKLFIGNEGIISIMAQYFK